MNSKIAILRGINVGGKRKILMADLKNLCGELGITNVQTYIQSGNIIFRATDPSVDLENKLETAISEKFGFEVPVIVRTSEELQELVDQNPFYSLTTDINKLHLTFLKEKPAQENIQQTESFDYKPDRFKIQNKDVFIYCEGKYHQSKLTNNFFEKKLKTGATTRNWKTVLKLLELSKG
ncbi:DUF1697 domain-containing protein [Salegentibacter sp. F188]|uniref:DUF1697 domain-containing protein n=1 Tax=Autumnicola patrickiae TaxID=3075591 RepID=A0ABU3DZI0_9FLAO|nr:DUF1697 domain-containing protein [Salegentibacter sp. F188]MDT0689150.1 DUF1697 domain-containing protein [Salegentibacter sp. F188]